LVRTHPLVAEVVALDAERPDDVAAWTSRLSRRAFDRVISLDDEAPLCRMASQMKTERLSGAYEKPDGTRAYTTDVAPWFDMGLLSVHGKARADELKVLNTKSHPQIYAEMLGIEMGKPELHLPGAAREHAREFARRRGLGP